MRVLPILLALTLPARLLAAPAILFNLNQSPVTGPAAITNDAQSNPAFWGTLSGSGTNPTLVTGATSHTGSAWQFNGGRSLAEGPDVITKSLGNANASAGLTVAFWVNYQSQLTDQWTRLLALGGSGEAFDASIQNAAAGIGQGKLLLTFGYNDIDGSRLVSLTTPAPILDGTWHHIAMTIDYRRTNNNALLYIDDVKQAALSVTVTGQHTVTNSSLYLGAWGNGSPWHGGALDQFLACTNALNPNELAELYNTGVITNYAPVILITNPATVFAQWTNGASSNLTVNLGATLTDDGQPFGLLTNVWTLVSGPAAVTITNPTNAATAVVFTNLGTYVFQGTVGDGEYTDNDQVTVVIATNAPPAIPYLNATPLLCLNTNPNAITLTARATDDGLPNPPGQLACQWSLASGPGAVTFTPATNLNTTALLPTNTGNYVLQLTVSDSQLVTTNTVTITVTSNLPPASIAWADQQSLFWPSNATTLRCTLADDGRPNPPGKTTNLWTQLSGPGSVTLLTPATTNCVATNFPAQGLYVFQVVASDGQLFSTNFTYVNVWSPGIPLVNAGSSRSVWLPNAALSLQGSYTNTTNGPITVQWSTVQGPGTVFYGNPTNLSTTVAFTNIGTYDVRLTVTNGNFIGWNDLVVQVYDSTTTNGTLGVPSGNFGYSAVLLNDFTNDLGLQYNYSGLNWSRLEPPPPPYVHPRILFNPDNLPDIRFRLTNTLVGAILNKTIRSTITNQIFATNGQWYAAYNGLCQGDMTAFNQLNNGGYLVGLMEYEAFRALLDNDAAGGARLAAALTTLATNCTAQMQANPSPDWRNQNSLTIHYEWMALAYDFAYNFMTPAQQTSLRQMFALATENQWSIGMDAVPALLANASNWIENNAMYLLFDALAIEGETGYDPNAQPRLKAAFDRVYALNIYPDGADYEGMGKGSLYAQHLLPLAKRGIWDCALTSPQNHIRQFYNHCLETFGYGWTWDELLGGNNCNSPHADITVLKYFYPNDPVIDFMARNELGATWTNASVLTSIDLSYAYDVSDPLIRAICAQDFATNLTYAQALSQQVSPNASLSFFSNLHGLLVTRSAWTTNALRLMFQPRSEPGGHSEPDRNMFNLDALGRIWVPQLDGWLNAPTGIPDMSTVASVLRIDDVGPSVIPSKVVDFADAPNYTFAVGDARLPYTMQASTAPAGALMNFNFNQNLLYPSSQPWANLPWGELPDWQFSDNVLNLYWTTNTPVQRAFRTATLVRGSTPYVLITDDIQKDTASHAYDWRMMFANDLPNPVLSGPDATFTSTNVPGHLLTRLLSAAGTPAFSASQYTGKNAIDITITNVAPDYKVLLLPYTNSTAPVTTTWSNNVLTIQMADGQKDLVVYKKYSDGRTRVAVYRVAGQGVVLSAPATLTATGGNAQVTLTWSNVAGATSYNLRSGTNSGGPYSLVATNLSGNSYTNVGVVNGQPYYYVLTAVNTNGESMNSPEAAATPAGPPPAPATLGANPGSNQVQLAWSPAFAATGYDLKRSSVSGSNYVTLVANWSGTNYTDTTVTNGTTYYYVVAGTNSSGEGPASPPVATTPNYHAPVTLIWQGNGVANVWDQQNPANLDWLNGTANVTFWNGDSVTFNDSGSATPALDLVGNLAPGGTVEVNTSSGYTFSGSGSLTGTCNLQKDGNGTLTLLTANSNTGTNSVNAGTLLIGNGGPLGLLGSGPIVLAANSILSFNTTTSLTNGNLDAAGATVNNLNAAGSVAFYQTPGLHNIGTFAGPAGATIVLAGDPASTNTITGELASPQLLVKFTGGNWFLPYDGTVAVNGEIDGGTVWATNRNFYWNQNNQSLTIHGGQLINTNTYGLRLGSTFGANNSGGNFTGLQDGGTVAVRRSTFELGSLSGSNVVYQFTGGLISLASGVNLNLGSDPNRLGTTTFTLAGTAKLSVGGTLNGDQANARQVFNFQSGTLVANTINASNLCPTLTASNGTLVNVGGTLAPGDLGVPGKTTILGNYTCSNAATLALDLGGTSQANSFSNGPAYYDFVSANGQTILNGSLIISLINNFTPAANNSFTILTSAGGLTGTFTNVSANNRVAVNNYPGGSFLVASNATSVILTNFQVLLAQFSANPTNGNTPFAVTFTDTSLGSITNRTWSFGDGTITNTTATTVAHTFTSAGNYPVAFTVTGPAGTNTASLAVAASSPLPPVISGISLSGTNLVVAGSNGVAGNNYLILTSTNLFLPVSSWTILATNPFGPGGTVNFTNPVTPDAPPTFYRLRLP